MALGLLGLGTGLLVPQASAQATLIVETTNDLGDIGDMECSLREAILNANANTDLSMGDCEAGIGAADVIVFDLPGLGPHTISPASELPGITDPVTIDGATQPGADCGPAIPGRTLQVVLDGSAAGGSGLTLASGSDGSTIRGLVLNQWPLAGLVLLSSGNAVECNFIGTDATGTAALGNGFSGVVIEGDVFLAANNRIGGTAAGAGNLISGNAAAGVFINVSDNNAVEGNFIGTDVNGATVLGNAGSGVSITNNMGMKNGAKNGGASGVSSTGNVIGGLAPGAGNVISGNGLAGVFIEDSDGNFVQGNLIGTDATGTGDLGNQADGVRLVEDAAGNTIGGTAAGAGNTIAFNDLNGVTLLDGTGSTVGNAIQGNSLFANDQFGIDLAGDGVTPNDQADADPGPNNLQNTPVLSFAQIDDNGDLFLTYFVDSDPMIVAYDLTVEFFEADADDEEGQTPLATDPYTVGDFPGPRQVNLGNAAALGVTLGDVLVATATDAANNTSEFSAPGVLVVPAGIVVNSTEDTTFPDGQCTLPEALNNANANNDTTGGDCAPGVGIDAIGFNLQGPGPYVISPTSVLPSITDPVILDGATQPGADCGADLPSRTLQIVLDGSLASPGDGLTLAPGSDGSTIQGLVINQWGASGLHITGSDANTVACTFIGTDVTGTADLGNASSGVTVAGGATGTVLGGSGAGAGNLVSGNDLHGVQIDGAVGTVVAGNTLGADVTGTVDLGNTGDGVRIENGAVGNTIGGSGAGEGNLVSGNTLNGVRIDNAGSNVVAGNIVGADGTGATALGNAGDGVRIENGAVGNTVGGTAVGAGNTVAFNAFNGVTVVDPASTGNAVLGNGIVGNGALGIDLGDDGPTPNDPGDGDVGPNTFQNTVVLTAVQHGGASTTVDGTLNSTPNTTFRVELFSSPAPDPSGFGEGQTFRGFTDVVTSAAGEASFTLVIPVDLTGERLAATATNENNDTSEFSAGPPANVVDLTLTKSDGGVSVIPGGGIVYTLDYANAGNRDAAGVILLETVPDHTRFDAAQSDPRWVDQGDGAFVLALGNVPAGAGGSVSFAVTVGFSLPSGAEAIINTARITDDGTNGPDANPSDNDAVEATPVEAAPDLRATKRAALADDRDGDGLADPGDAISYQIEIENTGEQGAGAVVFTDTPDAHTTLVAGSVRTSQGTVSGGNSPGDTAVQVDLGEIPAQEAVTIAFRVVIGDTVPPGVGSVSNQGGVSGSNVQPLATDDPTTPAPRDPTVTLLDTAPLIVATKQDQIAVDQDGDGLADPGDTIAYTVVLRNTGNTASTGVVFTDTPGTHTVLEAGSVGTSQGAITSGNDPTDTDVAVDVGVLPGGGTATISFRVLVDRPFLGAAPQVENQGRVAGDTVPNAVTDDPDTPAPDDPTVTAIDLSADLRLEKSVGTATPTLGSEVDFTLTLTNDGPAGTIAEVTDALPEGLAFVRAEPMEAYDPETGIWTVGALAPEASATLTLTALVETTESVTNTAEVTASTVFDPDSVPGDGSGDDYSEAGVTGVVPLLAADPSPVDFGAVATDDGADRTVTVTNIGAVDLEILRVEIRGGDGVFSLVSGGTPGPVPAGAAQAVVLRFAPSSGGAQVDTLEVVSDAGTLLVPLQGVGLLVAYRVDPATLTFGSLLVGDARVDSVEVINTGDVELDVTEVGVGGDDEGDFSVVRGGGALPAGASHVIAVQFAPSSRGLKGAQVTFVIRNDTLVVPLAGEGLAAEVVVDPSALEYGAVLPGDSTERPVQVANAGNLDLAITRLFIAGGEGSVFSLVRGEAGPLPAGAVQDVVVRFAPAGVAAYLDSLIIETTAGDVSVRLQGNGLAPAVTVTLPPDSLMAGEAAQIGVATPDLFSPTDNQLFYRRGGEQAYQQGELTASVPAKKGAFVGVIPAAFVTERGVDYYVRLSDGRTTVTFPETNPRDDPAHARVRVEQLAAPTTLGPETFRMVSVPLVLDDGAVAGVLSDNYGVHDIDRWRLFHWQSAEERYAEFPNLAATFTPGTAFWLITGGGGGFDVEEGRSVDASGPFTLTLPPGWSQIGTPFAFAIDWDDVALSGNVEAPVAYDGTAYVYDQRILRPWEGYFVFNAEAAPVTLAFPPVEAAMGGRTHAASTASGAYTVRLAAELLGYALNDTENVLGLADEAARGRDGLDRAEAPPIGDHVRLSIVERGERFAANFKPLQGEGQRWDVDVTAVVAREAVALRRPVRVRLIEQGRRPDGFELYVLDRDYGTPVPLDANTLTVTLSTDEPVRHLSLIVGTKAFAAAHSDDIPLTPLADVLEQNYPNPFNPETVVGYQVSRRSRVVLAVYDGVGRRVRTLVDAEQPTGRHEAVWDGRNDEGRAVASGVYFYRLQAGAFVATRAMTLLR